MNKTCNEIRDQFLDQPVPAAVKEHVQACAECAREWKSFERTFALLATWGAPEQSPSFDTRFRGRLNEVKAQEVHSDGWFAWLRRPAWRPVMAGALAVVMAIGVTVLYRQPGKGVIIESLMKTPAKGTAVADLKS